MSADRRLALALLPFALGACSWFTDFKQQPTISPWETASDSIPPRGNPQLMIYMLHNKTAAPLEVYIVLDVTFAHGTPEELKKATGRAHHDVKGILFGETYDVPRDPNGDGNPADAAVVGEMLLDPVAGTASDDTVTDYAGMGGQGVLALPLVYNGWSQQVPRTAPWNGITCRQRNPITFRKAC